MKQLIVRIEDDIHARFKARTALHGEKMTDLVTRWIHEYLQEDALTPEHAESQAIESQLTDSELMQAILQAKDWTHQELADVLLMDRTNVTRAANGKIKLRAAVRRKAEELLQEASTDKSEG